MATLFLPENSFASASPKDETVQVLQHADIFTNNLDRLVEHMPSVSTSKPAYRSIGSMCKVQISPRTNVVAWTGLWIQIDP